MKVLWVEKNIFGVKQKKDIREEIHKEIDDLTVPGSGRARRIVVVKPQSANESCIWRGDELKIKKTRHPTLPSN